LRDDAAFQRVRNGGYFIEWECGADLSVDTIEAHWRLLPLPKPHAGDCKDGAK
jgi:hypothetical protein